MSSSISPQGLAAEVRLSIMYEMVSGSKNQPLEIPYFLRKDPETGRAVAPYSPLPLTRKTFQDIGMHSIEELIEAFEQFDIAIAKKDHREILRCYMRILGDRELNIKLKGGER